MLSHEDIALLEKFLSPKFEELKVLLASFEAHNNSSHEDMDRRYEELRDRVGEHENKIQRIESRREHEERSESEDREGKRFVIENWVLGSATLVAILLWIFDKVASFFTKKGA